MQDWRGICVVVMSKACQMEYACNVVDSIPCEIRERIIEENPELVVYKKR